MAKAQKIRASKHSYQSPNQLKFLGFETPFEKNLNPENRWVVLAHKIPWDSIVNVYNSQLNNHRTGASSLNARVVIGSLIITHMSNFSDRETIQNIQENVYMQYFLGYSSFRNEAPFDASLFVEIRKRLGREQLEKINDEILGLNQSAASIAVEVRPKEEEQGDGLSQSEDSLPRTTPTHKGKLITDATACPQDIAYPTDLNLLNDARVQSESIIDELYKLRGLDKKPRTYRKKARN
jgi:IS5 family transposase